MVTEKGHHFEVYGPFDVELTNGKCLKPSRSWWDDVVDIYEGASPARAIGCYMFTMGDKNIKPWYIGKTVCKGGFRDESFANHKLRIYNEVIENYRGPPSIYFFPLITGSFHSEWSLSKNRSSSASVIEWLERFLIGMAYSRNSELMNQRDVTFLRTVNLRGILGKNPSGRPHGEIDKAKRALLGRSD